jgi:hypothetical protein
MTQKRAKISTVGHCSRFQLPFLGLRLIFSQLNGSAPTRRGWSDCLILLSHASLPLSCGYRSYAFPLSHWRE